MFAVRRTGFSIHVAPALRDNYIHLLVPDNGQQAIIIDPAEAGVALDACRRLGRRPGLVLNTHHHGDHTGGNEALARAGAEIAGPAAEPIPARNRPLAAGERIEIDGLRIEAIDAGGHTRGHLAYHVDRVVFTGDALFGAGCGRLFEGTPMQMWATLARLAALPDDTLVFFAHEYTLANLAFAAALGSPRQPAIEARIARERARRARNEPTVPTTIGEERRTNPFLWPLDPAMRAWCARRFGTSPGDPVACFAALRRAKDGWRG